MNLRPLCLTLIALAPMLLNAAESLPFKDDFSGPEQAKRRASRGEWKFADHTATCTQDDELYKKFKDHGPIIFYDLPHQDAEVRFSYRIDGAKSVVFTANGEHGHVFRFVSSANGTGFRAFPTDSADHASIALGKTGPKLKEGEWVDVVVTMKGTKATIKIGPDYTTTVEHPSLAAARTNLSIGFAFGTFSIRGWTVEKPQ